MANRKLSPVGLGYAAAFISALCMLILGILGNMGYYMDGVEAMQQWHLFFDLTFVGVVLGIIEAAVVSFIAGWLFGWCYNKVVK